MSWGVYLPPYPSHNSLRQGSLLPPPRRGRLRRSGRTETPAVTGRELHRRAFRAEKLAKGLRVWPLPRPARQTLGSK